MDNAAYVQNLEWLKQSLYMGAQMGDAMQEVEPREFTEAMDFYLANVGNMSMEMTLGQVIMHKRIAKRRIAAAQKAQETRRATMVARQIIRGVRNAA